MSLLTQSAWFTVRVVTATASGRDIARASVAQVVRFFFARTGNCAPSAPLPEKVDRFQIAPRCQCLRPRFSGVFFTATSESRRLSRFLVRRRPPSFLTATSGTTARRRVGWVIFLFRFSFLADFLFCSPVTALYPPRRRTRPPFPSRAHQAPLPAATTHDDADMPPRHRMRHVALPLAAAPTASLCPRHHASCAGLPSACMFSFFFFC
jgi:hypothetical protein